MGPIGRLVVRIPLVCAASVLLAIAPGSAFADVDPAQQRAAGAESSRADSGARTALPFTPTLANHGPLFGHLPPRQENLQVVGERELTGEFGDVVEGQIADLAVYKGFAYLNSWDEPSCTRGGTYIADIRNPANPQEVGFLPATPGYYHGEGAHVVTLNTPQFQGDLLAVNDEACSNESTRPPGVTDANGGFDLYDVSDPANPVTLGQNFGDRTPDGALEPVEDRPPNSYHSVFVWQDGPRAFLVATDNVEFADVDIYDITDPRNPEFINDFDLFTLPEYEQIVSLSANGNNVFNHDMVVKPVGGQMRMLVSYWDGGYVQLDVSDPANPTYITDTNFDEPDPLTGFDPPEGNAHQGEFSHDNQFLLTADEDFASHRVTEIDITSGPNSPGTHAASVVPGSAPASVLPDGFYNGPTTYGGYGCDGSDPVPERDTVNPTLDPGEEAILVLQRGPEQDPENPEEACFPGEKAANADAAGWDAVLLINRHFGSADDDSADCGSGGFSTITVALCTTHEAGHLLFNQTPGYDLPYPPGHMPALGTQGAEVEATPSFDGWGYAHLYDAQTSEEIDAFAIPESLDERFATGFGDLSIHELATDPTENLAYSSYYSGGVRVLRYSRDAGLEEVGAWIDDQGSNFWGIEQFTTPDGERLIAGSDRDFGLYLFRYTGPGAAQRPVCSDTTVLVPFKGSADVPLSCSDANGNPLRESTLSTPSGGTLSGDADSGAVTFNHTGDDLGPAGSFTFKANDGAADSNVATASLVAVARDGGRCFNPFVGSSARNVIVGSPFGDRISGAGGADSIGGRGGADCLSGDSGNDRVAGEAGNDRVSGNGGRDRVSGGAGRDRLFGGAGPDRLSGGAGRDRLSGGARGDRLSGGGGRDRLSAGGGRNRLSGGGGNDRISARNNKVDRINCGGGRDRVRADEQDRVADNCERVNRG